MKTQLRSRLGLAHVRDVLQQVCSGTLSIEQACASLGMAKTRIYELRGSFLKARSEGTVETWCPGLSGGNHAAPWDKQIVSFLRSAIQKGYNYAFAAITDLLAEKRASDQLATGSNDQKRKDSEKRARILRDIIASYHEQELVRILTRVQVVRLNELVIQMRGPVLLLVNLGKEVDLSQDQLMRIRGIIDESDKSVRPLMSQYYRRFISGDKSGEDDSLIVSERIIHTIRIRDEDILATLTDTQRTAFNVLQGVLLPITWSGASAIREPFDPQ